MATKQSADTLIDGSANKVMTAAERVSLGQKESITNVDAKIAKWRHDIVAYLGPNTISSGTWTISVTSSGFYGYSTAGATNAAYNYVCYATVTPGTWVIDVAAYKSNTSGIIVYEYSTDGGSNWTAIQAASVDMYNATLLGAVITSGAITISTTGRLDIRVRSTGTKNASSSAYYALTSMISVRRTA